MPAAPVSHRRSGGRGARPRILAAARALFFEHGINLTGVAELAVAARVSKRTLYHHFPSKDDVVTAYLRAFGEDATWGPQAILSRTDLAPRARLLEMFATLAADPQTRGGSPVGEPQALGGSPPADSHTRAASPPGEPGPLRGSPFLNAAVELSDPAHPGHRLAVEYHDRFTGRLTDLARAAGARNAEQVGAQLALLYDGAAAQAVLHNSAVSATVAHRIAASLLREAID